ncbi:unnamed protein product [Sphagnum compactum]
MGQKNLAVVGNHRMVYLSLVWASEASLMMCDAAPVCCYLVASSSKYYIARLIRHHPDWQGINGHIAHLVTTIARAGTGASSERKLNFKRSHFNCRSSVTSKANLDMEKANPSDIKDSEPIRRLLLRVQNQKVQQSQSSMLAREFVGSCRQHEPSLLSRKGDQRVLKETVSKPASRKPPSGAFG